MTKRQLIDAIQTVNRSAASDWLGTFDETELREYLDHLQITQEPRGGLSRWIRQHENPAVVTRKSRW